MPGALPYDTAARRGRHNRKARALSLYGYTRKRRHVAMPAFFPAAALFGAALGETLRLR
jgi:hypothetical protein